MDTLRNLELADYIGIFGVAGMVLGVITPVFNLPLEFFIHRIDRSGACPGDLLSFLCIVMAGAICGQCSSNRKILP